MGDDGDDEDQRKPDGDGGQVGTHDYWTHHRRQHVGDLQGEGCLKRGPRGWRGRRWVSGKTS